MKDFVILRILDRFGPMLDAMGYEYPKLRQILQVQLIMDSRRPATVFAARKKMSTTTERNGFLKSLWMYGLMGILLVPLVTIGHNYLVTMSLIFTVLMFFVMTSMIADFSTVLLDVRDRNILMTKPVNAQTVGLARVIHIILYLSLLTAAIGGPSLVGAFIAHGLAFGATFLVALVFMDLLIMALTAFVYLFFLRFFDGERLKDLINYVQIGLSIGMVLGYQVVGHVFQVIKMRIVFHPALWQVVVPPLWFGAAFAWLFGHQTGSIMAVLAVMAFIMPLILFGLYLWSLPVFERHLQKLTSMSEMSRTRRYQSLWKFMGMILCPNLEERTVFDFAGLMMAKEREFKLKAYPALGLAIVLPFLMFLNPSYSSSSSFHHLPIQDHYGYLAIYTSGVMIPSVLMMLKYSSQFKAAWIFEATPRKSPQSIAKGTLKAAIVRLILPVFSIETIIFLAVFGLRIWPDLLASALALFAYALIVFRRAGFVLPFSEPFQVIQPMSRGTIWLLLALLLGMAGVHFVFSLFPGGIFIYIALLIGINVILWRGTFAKRYHLELSTPDTTAI
ncbi:hypothetical protein [Sulfobacillus thermosulfidooxidans]|uniref:hypothetical protein n=1 Tax=Sulfobacillus thermosulfidooxidans TaxID=28034 RepID=UPI0006B45CF2|nr:hypothetical protein [Sulfobacillus thermosulfidooxidans]